MEISRSWEVGGVGGEEGVFLMGGFSLGRGRVLRIGCVRV